MKIKHLYHSGFQVETNSCYLVFDPISDMESIDSKKPVHVFVSHSHGDHFNLKILKKIAQLHDARFYMSQEMYGLIPNHTFKTAHYLSHYEQFSVDDIVVDTYGTTDLGNSYRVRVGETCFFHSGDLNWWHWESMTKSEQAQEANDYIIEINKLLGQAIDFAFVPVDPRLKEHAYLAANYFIETLHPKFLLPMHAFGEYSFYSNLQNHLKMHSTTLIKVVDKNQIVFDSTMK